jgi:hypothetical protein
MNRNLFFATRVIAVLLPVLGCRGASEVSPEGCRHNVEIAVLPGANPVFSWSPRCGVSTLSVSTVPSAPGAVEETMWGFSVPEQTPLGPRIPYGIAPSRATIWIQPRALQTGSKYRVSVWYTVGGDVLTGGGERVFTH